MISSLGIYSVVYLQDSEVFQAQVVAQNDQQALSLLWKAIVEGSDLLGPSQSPIDVQSIERLAEPDEVPFPEAVPDRPALVAVAHLQRKEK
jgi:hypothetical protein